MPVATWPPVRPVLRTAVTWLALWLVPVVALDAVLGTDHVLAREAVFFSQTAVVTFGGAYAVLAYVAQQAVESFGWLTPGEMLDGLGLAETTPGPLIQVVQFVGFLGAWRNPAGLPPLLSGVLGSLVTTWVTFVPCFLFIFAGAPFIEGIQGRPRIGRALAGITAAVVGVILNLAVWFALHTLFGVVNRVQWGPLTIDAPVWSTLDATALAIAALAIVAVFVLRAGMFVTLAGGAVLGVLLG
jgi:chromate transporter